jgi:hypothetical protein
MAVMTLNNVGDLINEDDLINKDLLYTTLVAVVVVVVVVRADHQKDFVVEAEVQNGIEVVNSLQKNIIHETHRHITVIVMVVVVEDVEIHHFAINEHEEMQMIRIKLNNCIEKSIDLNTTIIR